MFGYWGYYNEYFDSAPFSYCSFKFFAVDDMPNPDEVANITYNYKYKGKTVRTDSWDDARIGRPYPDPYIPQYVKAEKPAGNVTGDATIDINITPEYPFELSTDNDYHYYYLENVKGEGTRLYYTEVDSTSIEIGKEPDMRGYRPSAQAETVNGVYNDLWYVTGNPYEGIYIHNVAKNDVLKSFGPFGFLGGGFALTFTPIVVVGDDHPATWGIYKIFSDNDKVFGVFPYSYPSSILGEEISGNKRFSWKYNSENNYVGFGMPDGEDEACAFRFVPATFTYKLTKGSDGHTYNTFSAPFDVKVSGESDVKIYKGTVDYDELRLDAVAAAPAMSGVLLRGDTSEEVTLAVTSGAAAIGNNALVGDTANVTDLSDKLILDIPASTGKVGFRAAAEGVTTLAANHAYIMRSAAFLPEGLDIAQCGDLSNINWSLSDDGVLTITGSGNIPNYDVNDNKSPWYDNQDIKKVVIGEGISKVGANAFIRCHDLTTVELPSTMKSISEYAFAGCYIDKTLVLPEGLESIGKSAFYGTYLRGVKLPETLKTIGDSAFYANYFDEIHIPKHVTQIGNSFCGNSLGTISTITVDAANPIYTSRNSDGKECNAIITKAADADGNITLTLGCGKTEIPNNVTIIGPYAFWAADNFPAIFTIPNNVKEIGKGAFYRCGIKKLTIGSGVTNIKDEVFNGCQRLREIVTLAEEVPSCEANTFYRLTSCVLRVPTGDALAKYKADAIWGKVFSGNIKRSARVYAKVHGSGKPGTDDAFITLDLLCDDNEDFGDDDGVVIDDIPANFRMVDIAKGLADYLRSEGYDVSSWDESKPVEYVKDIVINKNFSNYAPTSCKEMFAGLKNLETITGIGYLNIGNVTDMSWMFSNCQSLAALDLSYFDIRNVANISYMLNGLSNIKYIPISSKFVPKEGAACEQVVSDCPTLLLCLPWQYDALRGTAFVDRIRTYVSINANATYGTLCVPIGGTLSADSFSGFDKLYRVKDANKDEGTVTLAETTSIEPGKAYVYHRDSSDDAANGMITFTADNTVASVSAPQNDGCLLKGTFSRTIAPANSYILQSDGIFHHVPDGNNKLYVGGYRAYLDLGSNTGDEEVSAAKAYRMVLESGETTGIDHINGGAENDERGVCDQADLQPKTYYDLMGRKVNNPQKDNIYIVNGKKVIYNK